MPPPLFLKPPFVSLFLTFKLFILICIILSNTGCVLGHWFAYQIV